MKKIIMNLCAIGIFAGALALPAIGQAAEKITVFSCEIKADKYQTSPNFTGIAYYRVNSRNSVAIEALAVSECKRLQKAGRLKSWSIEDCESGDDEIFSCFSLEKDSADDLIYDAAYYVQPPMAHF